MRLEFVLRLLATTIFVLVVAASAALHWRHELGFSGSDVLALLPVASAQVAIEGMTVPDGFHVSVVAAEPDIAQPIAMATDARGALWVAECRTYPNWNAGSHDQVVVFADRDADGSFESRSVFCSGLANLSGIEIGLGGVWLLCSPKLLFIPDRDADGRPDGPPQTVLDGWDDEPDTRPHVANSLSWGPDGWLYGCLGASSNSLVGTPGTPADRRVALNAAIWRYHPKTHAVELFASGTYNPWGLDFDETGELFVSNSMVAHLWQVVPGGRFERRGAYLASPASYEWMSSCTNHNHWSGGQPNQSDPARFAGGGHAHAGLLIYQGDNWPRHYRGGAFMCNLQGRSINHDSLDCSQHEAQAGHAGELLTVEDPSFRGVDLECGPDGTLFVADWNARGSCLGSDTHASNPTGRIYRIAFGQPTGVAVNLDQLSDGALVALHEHANVWFSRRARVVLQDRSYRGLLLPNTPAALAELASDRTRPIPVRLRAFWTWHVVAGETRFKPEDDLRWTFLTDPMVELRAWAVRLSVESDPTKYLSRLIELANSDSAGRVRRELISALHRLTENDRLHLAEAVLPGMSELQPRNWQRLCWYALEPLVAGQPSSIVELDKAAQCSFVNYAVARRVAELWSSNRGGAVMGTAFESLLDALPTARKDWRTATLQGIEIGLRANRTSAPPAWKRVCYQLATDDLTAHAELIASISAQFGESAGQDTLVAIARDLARPIDERLQAFEHCLARHGEAVEKLALELNNDPEPAMRRRSLLSLAAFDCDLSTLLSSYSRLTVPDRQALIDAATGRLCHARQLLNQVEAGVIPAADIGAAAARQLLALNDSSVSVRFQRCSIDPNQLPDGQPAERQRIARLVSAEGLSHANRMHGGKVFSERCGQCHKLNGGGGSIGPDLTGSQRNDVQRLIADVIEPSAMVSRQYQVTLIQTVDGRVITGIVAEETPQVVVLRSVNGPITVEKRNIDLQRLLPESVMPAGLLSNLTDLDVRDLFAYLMNPSNQRPDGGHE